MERGHITLWNRAANHGQIVGCSVAVLGHFFSFSIQDVVDPVLARALMASPGFTLPPNCAMPRNMAWVFFVPTAFGRATSIRRVFN